MASRDPGFSLVEILATVALLGVLAALAVPRLDGMLAVARTRGAANLLASDLAYTRALAVRRGERVRVEIDPDPACPAPSPGTAGRGYRVVTDGADRVVRIVDLRDRGGRLCVASNRPDGVAFDSRGFPVGHSNRTFEIRDRGYPADSLTLSVVGRVLRRF